MNKKTRKRIIYSSFVLVCCCAAVFFLLFTTAGAEFILRRGVPVFLGVKKFSIARVSGNFAEQVICRDFELDISKWLPGGGKLRAEKVELVFAPFSGEGSDIRIKDAKLLADMLPAAEMRFASADVLFRKNNFTRPVLFLQQGWLKSDALEALLVSARLSADSIQANILAKYISVPGILKSLPGMTGQASLLGGVSARITDMDLYVKGSPSQPQLNATFKLPRADYGNFFAQDCSGAFMLKLALGQKQPSVSGDLTIDQGMLNGPKGVRIKLQRSSVYFSGDPARPRLDVQGLANIEEVDISIALKGTPDKPDLRLSSDPSLPQERLLVMLATGKKWSGAEDSLAKNTITPDMAADLIDYFVLGGSGSTLARRLGLSEISFKLDEESAGVSVKKDITDKARIKYSVEQSRLPQPEPVTTQKVGGEIKLTPEISVSAEKELKAAESEEGKPDSKKPEDTIMLKLKKEF